MVEQMGINLHFFGMEQADFTQEQKGKMAGSQVGDAKGFVRLIKRNNAFAHLEFGIDPVIHQIVFINIAVEFILNPGKQVDLVVIRFAAHPIERFAPLVVKAGFGLGRIADDSGVEAEAVFGF